jgi:AhpD family alkylhydroperoxidase
MLAFSDKRRETLMSKSFGTITNDVSNAIGSLRRDIPETIQGFNALAKASLSPGVLSALDKELIALAIGVSSRCDACIGFHVKALIRLGVSREQLMETLAVCTYMGGGPALMYAAEAVRAYEELSVRKSATASA